MRGWYLSITDALRLLPNLQTMTGKDKRRANVRDLRDSRRVRLLAEGSGVTRVQEAYEMRKDDKLGEPENRSQKGQIEIDRSEDKCRRKGQVELRNEMNCDRGGVR